MRQIFFLIIINKKLNITSSEIYKILSIHPINIERVKKNELPGNIVLLRGPGTKMSIFIKYITI